MHAIRKLRAERLRTSAVESALTDCALIEDYDFAEGRPLPSFLVLGFVGSEPIHVVLALDEAFDRVVIVTVHRPSEERWENGWKQRKR